MNLVPFGGWQRNAKIVCNDIEMIVTLEVGPRVLFFGFTGGPNMFAVHPADEGRTGGDQFHSYGGHRLWIAPEEQLRTLRPDNEAVEYTMDAEVHVFTSPTDEYHTQKQIRIKTDPINCRFVLEHRIYNHGAYPIELSACGLIPNSKIPGGLGATKSSVCATTLILVPKRSARSFSRVTPPASITGKCS